MTEEKREFEDPIVAEVRAVREAYVAEVKFDSKALLVDLRKRQERMKEEGYKFSVPHQ